MPVPHVTANINYTRNKETIPSGKIELDVHDYASSSYAKDPSLIDPKTVPVYDARQVEDGF